LIDTTEPGLKDIIIRDEDIKGFLCKITPKGKKVYMLYYRTRNGRERKPSIGVHGKITCFQAHEIAKAWLADVVKGKDPYGEIEIARSSPTILELSKQHLAECEKQRKPKTCKEYGLLWNNYIIPALGKRKVRDITRADISRLHNSLSQLPTTANRTIAMCSRVFTLAEIWGYREEHSNPCRGIPKYGEKKKDRFLSVEEIKRLTVVLNAAEINGIEQKSSLIALRLLLFTGCRLSEILKLKWKYVDIANHRINFQDSKTGRKTVYIAPKVIEILGSIERKPDNPYVVYGNKEGAHLVNLQKAWMRIKKQAGLDDVRMHDLRHSFASIGAANGLSLPIIGALLGQHKA